jgi:hypothetical protein
MPPLREWLLGWIDERADPRQALDTLPGALHHLSDAWARRSSPTSSLCITLTCWPAWKRRCAGLRRCWK